MRFPNQADEGALEMSPLDTRPARRRGGRRPQPSGRWRVALAVCAVALAVVAPLVALGPTRTLLIGLLPTPTPAPPTPVPLHVLRPQATKFTSISMVSPSEGWAVGYETGIDFGLPQHPYLLHLLHGAWTVQPLPRISIEPHAIAMVSSTEGWIGGEGLDASGGYGMMLHAIGGHWAQDPLPASVSIIDAIDMVSPSEGWAAGSSRDDNGVIQGLILRYTQGKWTVELTTPDMAEFLSISMVSATEGWAAGGSRTGNALWHYTDGSWQQVTLNDPSQADLEYVSMLSPNAGWGIGSLVLPHQANDQFARTAGVLWRYSDGQWRVVARDHPNDVTSMVALQAISPDEVWISEGNGDGLRLLQYTGGTWQAAPTPTGYAILSFAMFNGRNGWAVGDSSQIMHEVNGTWRAYPTP